MSVTLHTTLGDIKIEVFCESVPKTAEVSSHLSPPPSSPTPTYHPHPAQNFLALCASEYYTSSPFHRSIPGFMIQTGSPARGTPKTSVSIWGDGAPFADEIRPSLRHNGRGVVSMANKGPGTNGSQFFICYGPAGHLDGKNTVFGRVLGAKGMETLGRLEGLEVDGKGRVKGVKGGEGEKRMVIEGVTVHANPLAG